jgi:hypothetical protein
MGGTQRKLRSIPDKNISCGFHSVGTDSGPTQPRTLGVTQPLTEKSTGNIEKKNLTAIYQLIV